MSMIRFGTLLVAKDNPSSVRHAARTAVAAALSVMVARLVRMPEAYWAAVSTLIVMQSSLGAALPVSAQRFAGTVLGAVVGAFAGTFFPGNVLVFAVGVFVIGLACTLVRADRSAFRYASITLAIVILVIRPEPKWVVAIHRFLEVSIGIIVGLAISALWPEGKPQGPAAGASQALSESPGVQ